MPPKKRIKLEEPEIWPKTVEIHIFKVEILHKATRITVKYADGRTRTEMLTAKPARRRIELRARTYTAIVDNVLRIGKIKLFVLIQRAEHAKTTNSESELLKSFQNAKMHVENLWSDAKSLKFATEILENCENDVKLDNISVSGHNPDGLVEFLRLEKVKTCEMVQFLGGNVFEDYKFVNDMIENDLGLEFRMVLNCKIEDVKKEFEERVIQYWPSHSLLLATDNEEKRILVRRVTNGRVVFDIIPPEFNLPDGTEKLCQLLVWDVKWYFMREVS